MSNSSVFKLDEKFLKDLHDKLSNPFQTIFGTESKFKVVNAVPTLEQLEELILTTFWASTEFEEGRLSRFGVTFAEPCPLDHLALIFDEPKRFTVEELRRLAPAVLYPDGKIGVWTKEGNGELFIWGIQTTDLISVCIDIIDPARVTVSALTNTSKIVEVSGQKSGFISQTWQSEGLKIMSSSTLSGSGTSVPSGLYYLPINVTQEILRRIRSQGHGGTIIFVPDEKKWKRFVNDPILYNSKQPLNEIQPIADALKHQLKEITGNISSENDSQHLLEGMQLLSDHKNKAFINQAANGIAYLTQVDGATVLSKTFKALAFGVKLKAPQRGTSSQMITKILPLQNDLQYESVQIDDEFRGTRHLSAARFVLANPESVAFVVSQDGGVTGFVNTSDKKFANSKLLAYRNLELLL